MEQVFKKQFDAQSDGVSKALDFVREAAVHYDVSCAVLTNLMLVVDEVVSNICRHAYPDRNGTYSIAVSRIGEELEITFTNAGIPFDPNDVPDPDLSVPLEDRPIGGLGVFFLRQLTSRITYEWIHRTNRLTLAFTLK